MKQFNDGAFSSGEIKILFVDDDPDILAGFRRLFRHQEFKLYTQPDPREALRLVKNEGPFAVVVSDMRMPGIDGLNFLKQVREENSNTICVILTGFSEMETTIDALNEGYIFRYLTKPCSAEAMAKTVLAAVQQHKLLESEQDVLGRTLEGCVELMVEVLQNVVPRIFGNTLRVCYDVMQIAQKLEWQDIWIHKTAALLSPIGLAALPKDVRNKFLDDKTMSDEEKAIIARCPEISERLVHRIPRMECVAFIIGHHHDIHKLTDMTSPINGKDQATAGALLLKTVLRLDQLLEAKCPFEKAIKELEAKPDEHHIEIVETIRTMPGVFARNAS